MPNRNSRGADSSGYNPKHLKNTDNESTQYISPNADNYDTAGFSTGYEQNRHYQQSPGRQQYYGNNQQGSQYNGQQGYNPNGGQYNGQSRNNPNGGQYNGQPRSNPNGGQYNGQPRSNPNGGQYNGQMRNNPNGGQYNGQPRRNPNGGQYNGQPRNNPNGGQYNGQPRNNPNGGQRNSQPRNSQGGGQTGNNRNSAKQPRGQYYQQPGGNSRQQRSPNNQQHRKNDNPNRPQQQRSKAPKRSGRKRTPLLVKILLTLLIIFIVIFVIYSAVSLSLIKKLNYEETGSRSRTSGAMSESYVTNVLLIGTDGRTTDDRGRSDSMILASINKKTNEITLTSFMRDSYVDIPGYGWEKLNASYSYGGPELLMDTIEKNFLVRIDDYVSVNFCSFASIIDSVGGIEIDVSNDEAQEINTILMAEVNEIMGDARDADLLSGGGKLQLNGKQALSYARIRHIGNADFERTERQRDVLTQVAGKLKSFKPSMISNIAKNAVPQITTNMTESELYLLSLRLPFIIGYDIEQVRIPADGTYGSVTTASGGDALQVDFETNYNILKDEVFAAD